MEIEIIEYKYIYGSPVLWVIFQIRFYYYGNDNNTVIFFIKDIKGWKMDTEVKIQGGAMYSGYIYSILYDVYIPRCFQISVM